MNGSGWGSGKAEPWKRRREPIRRASGRQPQQIWSGRGCASGGSQAARAHCWYGERCRYRHCPFVHSNSPPNKPQKEEAPRDRIRTKQRQEWRRRCWYGAACRNRCCPFTHQDSGAKTLCRAGTSINRVGKKPPPSSAAGQHIREATGVRAETGQRPEDDQHWKATGTRWKSKPRWGAVDPISARQHRPGTRGAEGVPGAHWTPGRRPNVGPRVVSRFPTAPPVLKVPLASTRGPQRARSAVSGSDTPLKTSANSGGKSVQQPKHQPAQSAHNTHTHTLL